MPEAEQFYVKHTDAWKSLALRHLSDPGTTGVLSCALITLIEAYRHAASVQKDREKERLVIELGVSNEIIRDILEALCRRDNISLASPFDPEKPAANYTLAYRLGIGGVFGLTDNYEEPA